MICFDFNKTSGCQRLPSSAIAARSKVEEHQRNHTPAVLTPLNVDKLALELVNKSDSLKRNYGT